MASSELNFDPDDYSWLNTVRTDNSERDLIEIDLYLDQGYTDSISTGEIRELREQYDSEVIRTDDRVEQEGLSDLFLLGFNYVDGEVDHKDVETAKNNVQEFVNEIDSKLDP